MKEIKDYEKMYNVLKNFKLEEESEIEHKSISDKIKIRAYDLMYKTKNNKPAGRYKIGSVDWFNCTFQAMIEILEKENET